jgi:multiple sugar transport system substrate-binding protein
MSALAPGRIIDGKLVRRTVWYPNVGHQIASDSKYVEAAYLVLQWASDGLISSWLTANPAGYYDPCRIPHLEDPLLVEKYHPYNMETEYVGMMHCTPPITIPGVIEFQNALDIQLQEAGTGRKTAKQAMKDASAEWDKIINRIGRDKHVKAVRASMDSWPSAIDTPTI